MSVQAAVVMEQRQVVAGWTQQGIRDWLDTGVHLHMQVESASQELEELREMKEDVERRERAQATVIENQAKRLDELETLYKVCQTSVMTGSPAR